MFIHYLKITFRNLWKYKSQTLISLTGLAVGFTCFALATLWIRYEMTYDSFHKNAKQLYVVCRPDILSQTGYSKSVNYQLLNLKETFPEIANEVAFTHVKNTFIVDDTEIPVSIIGTKDSSFLSVFDVKVIEGSREFLIGNNKVAITNEKARQLFGNENPIGKTVSNNLNQRLEICAVVSGMSERSSFDFDFIGRNWGTRFTIIELLHGTDLEAFEKKLFDYETGEKRGNISKMKIMPLTKMRYLDPDIEREVKFQHAYND